MRKSRKGAHVLGRVDLVSLCSHRVSPSSEQKGFESSGLGGQGSPKEKRLAEKKGVKPVEDNIIHFEQLGNGS
ncbi:hypothetical protein AK812_SmicGene36739 [Symbiodinium microadriaticum]|uniref:Uncharacterized protein n=1 Tax=Symbiodinium microadriaticum TaxID=2951 RepID=A0A1Q9CI27_SYMMI|nr:hypothetical protein AK812_SmicGene36739 [Symbiodinium microadriaticum]